MAFFERMREMARAAADGDLMNVLQLDPESRLAGDHLSTIWQEVRKEENQGRRGLFNKYSMEDISGPAFLGNVMEKIDRDEKLAFDDWQLSEGGLSFVKVFTTHAHLSRAQDLLRKVDAANDQVLRRMDLEGADEQEAPLSSRNGFAEKFAMRCDYLEALAQCENKTSSLPAH